MPDDSAPKTAYELAMERLQKRDKEAGVEHTPLTDVQRAQIAEIRNFYDAKLAEAEVLHHSTMRSVMDPPAREALEAEYRRDRARLTAERDSKINKARSSA